MEPLAEGKRAWVSVVIPALNEEEPIGDVVRVIPRAVVDEVLVVDNGSTDARPASPLSPPIARSSPSWTATAAIARSFCLC